MRWLVSVAVLCLVPHLVQAAECHRDKFDGAPFSYCVIDLTREEIRLWRLTADGTPFASFDRLNRSLNAKGQTLGVAMNGGMYHQDRAPVGLYVEDGQQDAPLVTRAGPGNFGLLPNGVFCVSDQTGQVIESRAFAAAAPSCQYATQSGPMLVIENALHPRFLPASDSLRIRNGVGVRADGREVIFAISDRAVNFHHFARFFRDRLGVANALYLDGRVSKLFAPDLGRNDAGTPMGPIVGTVRRAE